MFCIFSVFDTLSKKDIRVKHQIQEMNDNMSIFWTAPSEAHCGYMPPRLKTNKQKSRILYPIVSVLTKVTDYFLKKFCFVHPVKEGHTCKTSNTGNERQHVSILDRALFVTHVEKMYWESFE